MSEQTVLGKWSTLRSFPPLFCMTIPLRRAVCLTSWPLSIAPCVLSGSQQVDHFCSFLAHCPHSHYCSHGFLCHISAGTQHPGTTYEIQLRWVMTTPWKRWAEVCITMWAQVCARTYAHTHTPTEYKCAKSLCTVRSRSIFSIELYYNHIYEITYCCVFKKMAILHVSQSGCLQK